MDPINSIDKLAEFIRSKSLTQDGVPATKVSSNKTQSANPTLPKQLSFEELKPGIIKAVKKIAPDDPKKNKKMMSVFVEAILRWRFGDEMMNDPQFSAVVDLVGDALLQDKNYTDALSDVLKI